MNTRYDALVFVGRFQPFHVGHLSVIERGLMLADRVVVVVGSARIPRTARNPFTADERMAMIRASTVDHCLRVNVDSVEDEPYDEPAWIESVQRLAAGAKKVGLIGHSKDDTSYYLKRFPTWDHVDCLPFVDDESRTVDATTIREAMFRDPDEMRWDLMPRQVHQFVETFMRGPEYPRVRAEDVLMAEYRARWAGSPFPPVFTTVDAVVLQAGHVLLVKRKAHPGKGLGALPGGFIEPNERLVDAVVRELREETRIDLPETVIRECVKADRVFDDPYRSLRGRTITHAFLIDLDNEINRAARKGKIALTGVKGGSDAAKATWIPLAELDRSRMFEDHYAITRKMINLR